MSGALRPLSKYALMAWCTVKKSTGTTLPLHMCVCVCLCQYLPSKPPHSLLQYISVSVAYICSSTFFMPVYMCVTVASIWSSRFHIPVYVCVSSFRLTLRIFILLYVWVGSFHLILHSICLIWTSTSFIPVYVSLPSIWTSKFFIPLYMFVSSFHLLLNSLYSSICMYPIKFYFLFLEPSSPDSRVRWILICLMTWPNLK
jgi:hypothetical protein